MHNAIRSRLPEPFCYYKTILNTDHLHFGLWEENDPGMSMEEAQENMLSYLLSFFPSTPSEVLDVGCGLGLSAFLLSRRGHRVTAIAPSQEMIQYAQETYGDTGVFFKTLGFFDKDDDVFSEGRYDVLFFQESAQYISPLSELMKKARWLLRDNGLLIIGDETCYDASIKGETAVHLSRDFIVAFAEHGFRIAVNKKIGKNVSPTYDFVIREFTKNKDRIMAECKKKDAGGLNFFIDGWKKQKNWSLQGKLGYEIFSARKDELSINSYSAGDENIILPAFNEIFGVRRTLDHWYWKFRDNPYGSYKISQVFSGEGKLLAHYAGYPVPFYSEMDGAPTTFLSLQIGDTMTQPEARGIGRGKTSLLSRTAQHFYAKYCEGMVPFTYGFNTGTIKKLGERFLGYRYIDPIPFRLRNVKQSPLPRRSVFDKIFSKYSVRTVDIFDDTFDYHFERCSPFYGLLVKRESRYLTWRYLDCPDKKYIVVSVHKGKAVVGWSVFLRKGSRLLWGDALFNKEHPETVELVLSHVLGKRSCKNVETVEGWFPRSPLWWNEILDQIGFDVTREPDNLFPGFFILEEGDWLEKLQGHFYYTLGDSDLF
jgi:SAM-dependent methyltransferase